MHEETATERQMPKYKCHKEVWALKIRSVAYERAEQWPSAAILTVEEEGYEPVHVSQEYVEKHKPQVGGYFVVYEPDGYQSFSPADVFEAGYTLIS